jgi:hypothetical protein
MKKNKIISGAMALMVMACAAPATAVAAGGTVVFSASKETALPGDEFTIEVSLPIFHQQALMLANLL